MHSVRAVIFTTLQIGPSVVHLTFNSVFGKGAWIHTTVPEEPLVQRMTHYLYCDWWIPTFFADWFLLNGDSIQVSKLVNHKHVYKYNY